jgi:hypothetical protein
VGGFGHCRALPRCFILQSAMSCIIVSIGEKCNMPVLCSSGLPKVTCFNRKLIIPDVALLAVRKR